MSRQPIRTALAFAAIVAAAPVAAQSNFYIAGSLGHSSISANGGTIDAANLRNGFLASSTVPDNNDTAAKFDLGYRLGQNFAIEFGYAYLGQASFTSTTDVSTVVGKVKGDLLNLDLVGLWPMTQNFAFLARAGVYRWTAKTDMPSPAGGLASSTDHGWDYKFGAGLQYDVTKSFALRAEWERYNGLGADMKTGDTKVNLLSAGGVLKF